MVLSQSKRSYAECWVKTDIKFPDTELGRERVSSFFSLFYASINAGSLLSTFISPILREKVKCFDRDDCYFVAFLVPACLMAVAILGRFSKCLFRTAL